MGRAWAISIFGLLLLASGLLAPRWADSAVARNLFIDDRVQEVEAHETEADGFSRRYLTMRHADFVSDVRVVLLCLGAGLLIVGAGRFFSNTRRLASLPLAAPLLAALLVGLYELGGQVRLLAHAADDGLFGESKEEREERFFGRSKQAARIINERVPAGDHILLIDFVNSGDVQNVGYLVLPRRTFALPRPAMRVSAAAFRATLESDPRALDRCRDAGYSFAVDLRLLVETLSDEAIIPIAPLEEDG